MTDFLNQHPGSEHVLLEAAIAVDATSVFEEFRHTDAALQVMAQLVVPGLETLPYDCRLDELRSRARTWRWLTILTHTTVAFCVLIVLGQRSHLLQYKIHFSVFYVAVGLAIWCAYAKWKGISSLWIAQLRGSSSWLLICADLRVVRADLHGIHDKIQAAMTIIFPG